MRQLMENPIRSYHNHYDDHDDGRHRLTRSSELQFTCRAKSATDVRSKWPELHGSSDSHRHLISSTIGKYNDPSLIKNPDAGAYCHVQISLFDMVNLRTLKFTIDKDSNRRSD